MEKQWHAVHTQPHLEKSVSDLLTKKGIDNYCPFTKTVQQRSYSKKDVFKPLFVSYVFIYTTDEKYLAIKQTDGVINFLFWLAKPAIIKPEEIAAIKFYLNANYSLTVEKIPVNANDIVRITNEPIVPSPGNSLLFGEKTVKVHLPSLGYAILAAVNANTKVINAVDKFRYKAKGPFGIKWQEKFKVFG